ncbi:MAG: DNA translocase FtsK [Maledivibacter sp.]|jgi:S-DNA-T family DNA segregation ATPase FtsK/SpoIIIE|nr:DNA translocase FtsK [Maledivibacter sp.]
MAKGTTNSKGNIKLKMTNMKEKLLEKIKQWIINIIIVSIVFIALGLVYLNVEKINSLKALKGYESIAYDFISVGTVMILSSVALLNIKIIFNATVFMAENLLDVIKYVLKFLVEKVNSSKNAETKENCYEIDFAKKNIETIPEKKQEEPLHINKDCPPITLLESNNAKEDINDDGLKKELIWCFQKYDLDYIKIEKVLNGPAITRFIANIGDERISQVTKYEKEIAMTLGVDYITIKPDKDGLCFEIPNKVRRMIYHRDVLMEVLNLPTKTLEIPIGRTAIGEIQTLNIAKCPHILIAGQTGGGKSVCVNTIITSLILKNTPEKMKLILIDPKVVELSNYNGIPHLIFPVITDPKRAAKGLEWAVEEMGKRYKAFAKAGVRDIDRYNEKNNGNCMEKIVIVIDELADLMLLVGEVVEESIQRLGQLARAAGIHLIVATQRPSMDVVTGVIKANLAARIAFAVQDNTNSRIILDQAGAEKLLGNGDGYLFTTEMRNPERFQGSYISDREIDKIIDWWKKRALNYTEGDMESIDISNTKNTDEIYNNYLGVSNKMDDEENMGNITNYSDKDLIVRIYVNEIAYRSDDETLILPSTNVIRGQLGIRKEDLLRILKEMEKEGVIEMTGTGRGSKTYIRISQIEAYEFLKKFNPKALKE